MTRAPHGENRSCTMFGSDRECQWVFGVSANVEKGAKWYKVTVKVQGTEIVFRSSGEDKTADQAADNLETVLQLYMEERIDSAPQFALRK